jgi:hypothetical protein
MVARIKQKLQWFIASIYSKKKRSLSTITDKELRMIQEEYKVFLESAWNLKPQ